MGGWDSTCHDRTKSEGGKRPLFEAQGRLCTCNVPEELGWKCAPGECCSFQKGEGGGLCRPVHWGTHRMQGSGQPASYRRSHNRQYATSGGAEPAAVAWEPTVFTDGDWHLTDEDWPATTHSSPTFAGSWAITAGGWLLVRGSTVFRQRKRAAHPPSGTAQEPGEGGVRHGTGPGTIQTRGGMECNASAGPRAVQTAQDSAWPQRVGQGGGLEEKGIWTVAGHIKHGLRRMVCGYRTV